MSQADPEGSDSAAGVDFVVGDASVRLDPDESLAGPPEQHGSRRIWAIGALAAVGAVVVIRAAGSHDAPASAAGSQRPTASAPASATSAPPVAVAVAPSLEAASTGSLGVRAPLTFVPIPGEVTDVPVLATPLRPIHLDPQHGVQNCPNVYACTVDRTVPADVVAAVQAAFPTANVREVATVYGRRDGGRSTVLLQRGIEATAGETRVTIDLHSRLPDEVAKGGLEEVGAYDTTYYRDLVPLYTITVSARLPRTDGQVPFDTLAVLADDDGLLAR